ncbi:MAG TPA: cobyrinate a,c-diamide synthase [Rhodanobacteraceae bacterium]
MNARSCPAWFIAAPASGQGKTTATAALARYHARQGKRVAVFKAGPDFLDPLITARASGSPTYQLDLWMCGEADVRARLYAAANAADLILVEGAMGLFDGHPSSADLAEQLGLPVVVVVDVSAMAQTLGALLYGLAHFRKSVRVAGVIANRAAGDYHIHLLRETLPDGIRWLGALPSDVSINLPARHLGLVAADELADLDRRLDALADTWDQYGDSMLPPRVAFESAELAPVPPVLRGRRIAIARDAAFCFLYPANIDLLRAAGAELRFFAPVAGEPLPECDAVWLPGGYPELHLAALSKRGDLAVALRAHCNARKPLLAECGGLLFALDTLSDSDGRTGAMAGLLPGTATVQAQLAALGLQEVALPEGRLRGHTFHHARAEVRAPILAHTHNPNGGPSIEAVFRVDRLTATFMHLYFPSNPEAAVRLFLP